RGGVARVVEGTLGLTSRSFFRHISPPLPSAFAEDEASPDELPEKRAQHPRSRAGGEHRSRRARFGFRQDPSAPTPAGGSAPGRLGKSHRRGSQPRFTGKNTSNDSRPR